MENTNTGAQFSRTEFYTRAARTKFLFSRRFRKKGFLLFILLLRFLRLSLTLSLRLLHLFVLNNIARLDDFRDGIIIQNVLTLLDDFFQKSRGQVNLSVILEVKQKAIKKQNAELRICAGIFRKKFGLKTSIQELTFIH